MLYYCPTQILIFSLLTSTRRPGAWKVTFNRLIKGLGYLCSNFYECFKGKKINFPINSYSGLRPLESKLDNKESSSVHLVLAARLLQCIVSRRMLQLTRSTIFATVFCIIRIFFFTINIYLCCVIKYYGYVINRGLTKAESHLRLVPHTATQNFS